MKTAKEEKIMSDAYDWLARVAITQKRWLTNDELWAAYPFKKTGLNRQGLDYLISIMKEHTEQ